MMRHRILFLISLTLTACSASNETEEITYDYLIYNAHILDGTGSPAYEGYVAIKNDEIVAVSWDEAPLSRAKVIIDAQGRLLTPGFIDLHAHGDPLETPAFENFLAMGVTTISLGQDGSSPSIKNILTLKDTFQIAGLGTNLIMFYGHGTLREESEVGRTIDPDSSMTVSMTQRLDSALKYCHGLSLGLEYSPGLYASEEELMNLAELTGKNGRMIMSHIRNEDDPELQAAMNEMFRLGNACRVHISHLKSVYGQGADRADEILQWLYDARAEDRQITADIYPYTASYTGIGILFPEWAKTNDQFNEALSTRRQELEDFLRQKVESRNGPEATLIGSGPYAGLTLAEAAEKEDTDFVTLLIENIGPQGASGAYFVMNDSLQQELLTDSLVAICSDGSPTGFHPRGHGTYARVIEEFVLNRQALSLEEAIRKMTSYPAKILNLPNRGLVAPGMKADLLLFTPEEIHETADYQNPTQLAEGFDFVMVNGKIQRENGVMSDSLYGRFILPK